MTEFEICQEFRQSKEPRKQIGILADLNTCSKREIAEILIRNGCEGVPKYYVNNLAAQNEKAPGAQGTVSDGGSEGDVPPAGETVAEEAAEKTTPATAFVDAQALYIMMTGTRDIDDLWGMPVTVNGKRVGCATISGWWNPREGRVSWVLELTV